MVYHFAVEKQDYADYAGGRVFYSLPGQPAFPVRLASEIFQRCLAYRRDAGPVVVYDPCCGGAYHLSVLGFLHGQQVAEMVGSDVNTAVLPLAQRNLSLLTNEGLLQRIAELQQLHKSYKKPSHAEALASARRLRAKLQESLPERAISVKVFVADVMDGEAIRVGLNGRSADIIFSDIPYGWLTAWHSENTNPIWQLLESLRSLLAPGAVVALVTDKQQKVAHERYVRLETFRVGKRRVWIGRPFP
jgi:hypothetical protein